MSVMAHENTNPQTDDLADVRTQLEERLRVVDNDLHEAETNTIGAAAFLADAQRVEDYLAERKRVLSNAIAALDGKRPQSAPRGPVDWRTHDSVLGAAEALTARLKQQMTYKGTIKPLAGILGLDQRAVQRGLQLLVEQGKIQKIGSRNAEYVWVGDVRPPMDGQE